MHVISRSVVGPAGASTRTSSYLAPQLEQSNRVVGILDMVIRVVRSGLLDAHE
jgi:hypothetical protein